MSVFATADHHFGHTNIIKFCDRPFVDAHDMDRAMISAWNSIVGPEDTVYHLGDFTLTDSLSPWIHALNFARLYIIPGGHDYRWLAKFDRTLGPRVQILDPLVTVEFPSGNKYPNVVVMCHYPMLTWDRSHYGSLHLHGHSHGGIPSGPAANGKGRRIDVGVDGWDFFPVDLQRLLEVME